MEFDPSQRTSLSDSLKLEVALVIQFRDEWRINQAKQLSENCADNATNKRKSGGSITSYGSVSNTNGVEIAARFQLILQTVEDNVGNNHPSFHWISAEKEITDLLLAGETIPLKDSNRKILDVRFKQYHYFQEVLGKEDKYTVQALKSLADELKFQKNRPACLEAWEELLQVQKRTFGKSHPHTRKTKDQLKRYSGGAASGGSGGDQQNCLGSIGRTFKLCGTARKYSQDSFDMDTSSPY